MAANDGKSLTATGNEALIQVCVRKRPIFPHEISSSEFDVVTCCYINRDVNSSGKMDPCVARSMNSVIIHDARMHSDMKRMYLDHHNFVFHKVFDEKAENDEVKMRFNNFVYMYIYY